MLNSQGVFFMPCPYGLGDVVLAMLDRDIRVEDERCYVFGFRHRVGVLMKAFLFLLTLDSEVGSRLLHRYRLGRI